MSVFQFHDPVRELFYIHLSPHVVGKVGLDAIRLMAPADMTELVDIYSGKNPDDPFAGKTSENFKAVELYAELEIRRLLTDAEDMPEQIGKLILMLLLKKLEKRELAERIAQCIVSGDIKVKAALMEGKTADMSAKGDIHTTSQKPFSDMDDNTVYIVFCFGGTKENGIRLEFSENLISPDSRKNPEYFSIKVQNPEKDSEFYYRFQKILVVKAEIDRELENEFRFFQSDESARSETGVLYLKSLSDAATGYIHKIFYFLHELEFADSADLHEYYSDLRDYHFMLVQMILERLMSKLRSESVSFSEYFKADTGPSFTEASELIGEKGKKSFSNVVRHLQNVLTIIPKDETLHKAMRIWYDAMAGLILFYDEKLDHIHPGRLNDVKEYITDIMVMSEILKHALMGKEISAKENTELFESFFNEEFVKNKITLAEFYAMNILPICEGRLKIIQNNSDAESGFIFTVKNK